MPDERKTVGSEVSQRVGDAGFEVVQEGVLRAMCVGIPYWLVENRSVAGFLDVGAGAENEPEMIIVKIAADLGVALFF